MAFFLFCLSFPSPDPAQPNAFPLPVEQSLSDVLGKSFSSLPWPICGPSQKSILIAFYRSLADYMLNRSALQRLLLPLPFLTADLEFQDLNREI
jgi:hypothetical protein